jgi:hypothetical protein
MMSSQVRRGMLSACPRRDQRAAIDPVFRAHARILCLNWLFEPRAENFFARSVLDETRGRIEANRSPATDLELGGGVPSATRSATLSAR